MRLSPIALLIYAAACAPFSPARHPVPYRWAVLQVENRGTRDLEVFALQTSDLALNTTHASVPVTTRVHMGRVSASAKSEFPIPLYFLSGKYSPAYDRFRRVHFVIDQVDGKSGIVDQELILTTVDTVSFTIPPI